MPIGFDQEITKELAVFCIQLPSTHLSTQVMNATHYISSDRQATEIRIPVFIV